jgi:hypothetical protein
VFAVLGEEEEEEGVKVEGATPESVCERALPGVVRAVGDGGVGVGMESMRRVAEVRVVVTRLVREEGGGEMESEEGEISVAPDRG